VTARAGEGIRHLDDLLLRRTRAGLVQPDFAEHLIAPALAACTLRLGWDAGRCASEAARYCRQVRARHATGALV